MEETIGEQIERLCDYLESNHNNKTLNLRGHFNIAVLNSLWEIITGEQNDLEDKELTNIVELLDEVMGSGGSTLGQLSVIYPIKFATFSGSEGANTFPESLQVLSTRPSRTILILMS